MKMDFNYFFGCKIDFGWFFGKRALDVLKCMYTSSIIYNETLLKIHMLKLKGDARYRVVEKDLRRGYDYRPCVCPDGSVALTIGTSLRNETMRNDMSDTQLRNIRLDVTAHIAMMSEMLKIRGEADDSVFVFPADGGDIEITIGYFKLFLNILEHKGEVTKRTRQMYGDAMIDEICGGPEDPFTFGMFSTFAIAHFDACKEAYSKLENCVQKSSVLHFSDDAAAKKMMSEAAASFRETMHGLAKEAAEFVEATDEQLNRMIERINAEVKRY